MTSNAWLVASTNGITGMIRPDGSVAAQAPLRRSDVLVESVALSRALTLGLRLDGWVGSVVWPLVVLLLLLGALAYRRDVQEEQTDGREGRDPAPAVVGKEDA